MDHSGIQGEGTITNCSACNARLQIIRESFARMAYGSSSGKSCASCGGRLGAGINCSACGALFPDFFVAADPAVVKRQARERKRQQMMSVFRGIEFSFPDFKRSATVTAKPVYTANTATNSLTFSSFAISGKLPKIIAGILLVAAISGGGYALYAKNKAEQLYVSNYFKALYAIKTGADISLMVTSRISSDWKVTQDSGGSFSALPSTDELSSLNKVKSKVDKMIGTELANPPEKFALSRDGLIKLNDQYSKLYVLASAPPKSLAELNSASQKASASFDEATRSLKSTLPEVMSAELVNAKKKYKNLKDF
jgi:hypothetical protein